MLHVPHVQDKSPCVNQILPAAGKCQGIDIADETHNFLFTCSLWLVYVIFVIFVSDNELSDYVSCSMTGCNTS